jgi:hypothetical protein
LEEDAMKTSSDNKPSDIFAKQSAARFLSISGFGSHSGHALLCLLLFLSPVVLAQRVERGEDKELTLGLVENSRKLARNMSLSALSAYIKRRLDDPRAQNGSGYFLTAELMRQTGDYRAQDFYEKAIAADDAQPGYEFFYAEYLRNFRGPQRPLFPGAEKHYFAALGKLEQWYRTHPSARDTLDNLDELGRRIERGLITLYQQDGLPLLSRRAEPGASAPALATPFAFLSTVNRFAVSPTDFDEVHDVRDFTSEALFAASATRLNRDLTEDELRAIVRSKQPLATFDRLRFRYHNWPVLDLFYQHRKIEQAQITNFFEPDRFNKVKLDEFGVAVEKPFNVAPYFDFALRGAYHRIRRQGVVEFLPATEEDINQFEGTAAVSRFFGPDKANLEFTYVFQDINPATPNPPTRDRKIIAATLNYQILRPLKFLRRPYEQQFSTRGLHLFGGIVEDKERFGVVVVRKHDYFVGTSLNGLGQFDITVQPGIFTSAVSADTSQHNSQYRTDINVRWRILDEETTPGIPSRKILGLRPAFLHLVVPFKQDVALEGPNAFANFKLGVGLSAKLFRTAFREPSLEAGASHRFTGTTFLLGLRYDYQRFYRLDKSLNLLSLDLSMGF